MRDERSKTVFLQPPGGETVMKNRLLNDPVEHLDTSEYRTYLAYYFAERNPGLILKRKRGWRRRIVVGALWGAALSAPLFLSWWLR
jgi:hypothetical protein